MAIIEEADKLYIENRGWYCTLWLDAYPEGLRVIDKCEIDGLVFEQIPVHFNFHDAKKQLETAYIAIKLEDDDLPADWFIGREVAPA